MAEPGTVVNEYRVHLGWALPGARTAATDADDPFAVARRAMEADAWRGGQSDAFYRQCVDKGSTASRAAGDCVDTLEARYQQEPPRVDPSDARARVS